MSKNNITKFVTALIILAICLLPFSSCVKEGEPLEEASTVKNVILLIGDGMGPNHIEAAKIYKDIVELNMETMPYRGEVSTSSLFPLIPTDSAAAASAMATGNKVKNYSISYNDGNLKSITEYAIENGKKTGLVVTKSLTDATPAAFSAHSDSRNNSEEIAAQQINSGIDILIGEGREIFDPYKQLIIDKGYDYINTKPELDSSVNGKLFGIFNSLTPDCDTTLPYLTNIAINTLNNNNPNGFFLMVEGSEIDSKSHDNNFSGMVEELIRFDEAVEIALEFAKADKNTMVIVTADHETGNLILSANVTKENLNNDCYHSSGHTAQNVLFFSYGGMACTMPEKIENTDIFLYVMRALNFTADGE